MTFRALRESPVPVRAVAIYSGLYDLRDLLRSQPDYASLFRELIPDYRQHARSELDKRSVNRWVDQLPPYTGVLVVEGDERAKQPGNPSREFTAHLEALGRPHRVVYYDDESYLLDERREEVRDLTLAWFHKFQHPQFALRPIPTSGGR